MSHGNWGCRVEDDMPGELGTLARTFNRMSRELEVSYRSVEEVAEHRARELKTERKHAQASDARLAAIVESSEDAIIGQTLDGTITSWNDAATRLFGYTPEEAIGQRVEILQTPELADELQKNLKTVRAGGRVQLLETMRCRKDGRRIHVSLSLSPIFDDVGKVIGVAKIAHDITERKRAEQALNESERFARSTVDALTALIAILDESGTILAVNRAWAEYVSTRAKRPSEFMIGANYLMSCGQAAGASPEYSQELAAGIRSVLSGDESFYSLEYPAEGSNEKSWFVARVSRFQGEGPTRAVVAHENVTERHMAEERLRHDSVHDALTGLPNRALFYDRVDRCVARAQRRPDYKFAVLFLDLDRFKVINDSLGHAAGDHMLTTISDRLRRCLRGNDSISRKESTVARMGGDEFTILLDDLADDGDVIRVAERIQSAMRLPMEFEGHEISTTASIGIVTVCDEHKTAKDLLRDADVAMYRAKTAGKARYVVFNTTMHQAAMGRLRLENDLRHAIERDELVLHYQPIVTIADQELAGFEALVRWQQDGKLVSPMDFIPVAEDTGLIVPIGAWVLKEACRQLREWDALHPGTALTMSVNLSRRQLTDPALPGQVSKILADTGVAPARLKLEITESAVMEDPAAAKVVLDQIRALGISLHMDDFGTGHSSLSCLHQFPIDGLKIDRCFVRNIAGEKDHVTVLTAIVALARGLGVKVVAEGIERAEELAIVQSLGCDYGQGYYFAKPMASDKAGEFIAQRYRAAA
jgi:diguanylate cyclase (GGDEF)-like protein/PAS domain S-box-containing protein